MSSESHSAVRRLLGRGSIYTLCLAIQLSAGLLVVPILTRLVPAQAYGRIAASLVVVSVVQVFATGGLSEVAARAWFRDDQGPDHALRLALASIPVAVVVGLVFDLTGPLWAQAVSLHYDGALRVAVWAGSAGGVLLTAQGLLRAADRPWTFMGITALASAGAQGLALAFTAAYGTPFAYMGGVAIGTVVAALAALDRTHILRGGMPSLRELKAALRIGLPILPHNFAVFALAAADRLVIVAVLGLQQAGRYQVAYAVGGMGVTLITALNQAWLPLFLGASEEQRWNVLARTSAAVHRIAIATAGTLALLSPIGLAFAAPASYGRSSLIPVSAVVAASAVPYATCSAYFHGLFFEGNTRAMAISAPIAAAVNIGMDIVLLRPFGLIAAAFATVAAYALFAVVGALASHTRVGRSDLLANAAWSWLATIPVIVAGALLPSSGGGLIARGILTAVLLGAVARPALSLWRAPPPPTRELKPIVLKPPRELVRRW